MALAPCRECGVQISTSAKSCPNCGARVARTRWWLVVPALAITAFLALGAIQSNTPEGLAESDKRAAIKLCWKTSERRSLDPATQRFAAAACERMEHDFRKRFGHEP